MLYPAHLQVLPNFSRLGVFCPSCGCELEDAGPRPNAIEMKVLGVGATKSRFTFVVEAGTKISLGRAELCHGHEGGESLLISRQHFTVRFTGSFLEAMDEHSANGTDWKGGT